MGGEEQLERFDVRAADIDESGEISELCDDEPGEAAQRVVGDIDGRGAHRDRQLIQIRPGSDRKSWCRGDNDVPFVVTDRTVIGHDSQRVCGAHRSVPAVASIASAAR